MLSTIDRFRGVKVEVSDLSGDPQEFLVKFTSRLPGAARRFDREPEVAPRPAVVVVRVDDGLDAVGFMPPEPDASSLGEADYERKALDVVRDHLAARR